MLLANAFHSPHFHPPASLQNTSFELVESNDPLVELSVVTPAIMNVVSATPPSLFHQHNSRCSPSRSSEARQRLV